MSMYVAGKNQQNFLAVPETRTNILTPTPTTVPAFRENAVIDVAATEESVTFLTDRGELYIVRSNDTRVVRLIPLGPGGEDVKFKQIAGGGMHCLGLTIDGSVYYWGEDRYNVGVSGISTKNSARPIKVSTLPSNKVFGEVFVSRYTSFCLSTSGEMYGFGHNTNGELALTDDRSNQFRPVLAHKSVERIWVGYGWNTFIRKVKGAIYAFGYNGDGALSIGAGTTNISVPRRVILPNGVNPPDVLKICTSHHHSVLLTKDKKLYGVGADNQLAFKHGKKRYEFSPIVVRSTTIVDVAVGNSWTVILYNDGIITTMGTERLPNIGRVPSTVPISAYRVEPGFHFQLYFIPGTSTSNRLKIRLEVVCTDGDAKPKVSNPMYVVGKNQNNYLAVSSQKSNIYLPRTPTDSPIDSSHVIDVASTEVSSTYLLDNGELYIIRNTSPFPTRLIPNGPDVSFVQICSGGFHYLGLSTDGHVYYWGEDKYNVGVSGMSSKTNLKPVKVYTLPSAKIFVKVAAARYTSFCLTYEGELYGFGHNTNGELGLGANKANQAKPILIHRDVEDIWAGYGWNTFIKKKDGTIYSFGYNGDGALSIGSARSNVSTPQKVRLPMGVSYSDVLKIYASHHHSLLVTKNKKVYAVGATDQVNYAPGREQYVFSPVTLRDVPVVDAVSGNSWTAILYKDGSIVTMGTEKLLGIAKIPVVGKLNNYRMVPGLKFEIYFLYERPTIEEESLW